MDLFMLLRLVFLLRGLLGLPVIVLVKSIILSHPITAGEDHGVSSIQRWLVVSRENRSSFLFDALRRVARALLCRLHTEPAHVQLMGPKPMCSCPNTWPCTGVTHTYEAMTLVPRKGNPVRTRPLSVYTPEYKVPAASLSFLTQTAER
jgi:hypothetical protein